MAYSRSPTIAAQLLHPSLLEVHVLLILPFLGPLSLAESHRSIVTSSNTSKNLPPLQSSLAVLWPSPVCPLSSPPASGYTFFLDIFFPAQQHLGSPHHQPLSHPNHISPFSPNTQILHKLQSFEQKPILNKFDLQAHLVDHGSLGY